MFELPEFVILAGQINETLKGKTIQQVRLGNVTHKFVWYNRDEDEFDQLSQGKTVGEASPRGKWLFIQLNPGYVLLFGECGGKMLYHAPGAKLPKKYHLHITFDDDSFFTMTTQMWGAMELHEKGQELEREYVKGMRTTPIEPEFTFSYFSEIIDDCISEKKRSVKGLLTQDQLIPGLGNAIAQDIMFHARLHPRHDLHDLTLEQRQVLYTAIMDTVDSVIQNGGRYDEVDLYNHPGNYVRLMDRKSAGNPCPECGTTIEKIQYLGGACYLCPTCQQ